jgi:AcrR family transcriptional regulator
VPLISRDKAVEVSIELIDRDGLEAFSLPRLARALGVQTPSLYHHFDGRADLGTAIAGAVIQQTKLPRLPSDPHRWQDWFVQLAINFRKVLRRHREVSLLLVEYIPREKFAPIYEMCAELLENAGVPADVHMRILDGLESVVYGAALFEVLHDRGPASNRYPLSDASRYPRLARAVSSDKLTPEQRLEAKVRSYLTGCLALTSESAIELVPGGCPEGTPPPADSGQQKSA